MPSFIDKLKNYLIFREPEKIEQFILKEAGGDFGRGKGSQEADGIDELKEADDSSPSKQTDPENENKVRIISKREARREDKSKKDECSPDEDSSEERKSNISRKLDENLAYIKKRYTIPKNSDAVLREFYIAVKDKPIPAFIIFFDGMVDRKVIDDDILQPLMILSNLDIKSCGEDVADYIENHILPHNQMKVEKDIEKVIDEINFGGCGIFIDGIDEAFTADVKGWEHRGVERPNTELVLRGPQEGFSELLRANTALIRKMLKDEDVIVEGVEIGKRSKTPCSILYIKDIANDSLVKEVRRRLKGIRVDYVIDSGEIEQYIEDSTIMPAPQILSTERPDRVASMLTEGRVAVIMNGSPFALVMPITNYDLTHSPEDMYIRFPYANMLRAVRILAIAMSLLLPGLYMALTTYHQEMIPTQLLFAIEASREKVPFPSLLEILIMEVSFELIREAGIRIPGPIGPTLGIIGALILGQAAVAANIVSPILIILVAVTGLGSFAIPSFPLAFSYRLGRFIFIFMGAMAGFLGITTGIFIYGIWLVSAKSFGVPYISPVSPKTSGTALGELMRLPIWKREKRPDFVNPKDLRRQPFISRKWLRPESEEHDE